MIIKKVRFYDVEFRTYMMRYDIGSSANNLLLTVFIRVISEGYLMANYS